MKFCYCDETGTGEEPYAVLLGVLVDASRMHVTKEEWSDFLDVISAKLGHRLKEFHTRHFYAGNGIWRNLSGVERSEITSYFIDWFVERKHHVVFSAINKTKYQEMKAAGQIHSEIDTLWKTMGFHVALAVQRNFQTEAKNKGNTIFVFDEEVIEEPRFQQLILSPPSWSDSYYSKQRSQKQLCQVVDAPYFANSKNVGLLQVADFLSYFVRRYIEIKENSIPEQYLGEAEKVGVWFDRIKSRTIPYQNMYPRRGRCGTAELFWKLAPDCIKNA